MVMSRHQAIGIRTKLGWNQEEWGAILGCSRNWVSRWECGLNAVPYRKAAQMERLMAENNVKDFKDIDSKRILAAIDRLYKTYSLRFGRTDVADIIKAWKPTDRALYSAQQMRAQCALETAKEVLNNQEEEPVI